MSPVIGIPIGILVALAGAWVVIAIVRRFRSPLGWVLLLVAAAGLFASRGYIKRQAFRHNQDVAHKIVETSPNSPGR